MKRLHSCARLALCAAFLLVAPAFAAPDPAGEQAPAKADLTRAYVENVCKKTRQIFLDFDSNSSKLKRPSGRVVLETIQAQLRDSPVKDPQTLAYPQKGGPDEQRLITTYNSLWRVDSQLRPAALRLIGALDLAFVPEKFHRLTLAFEYLNDEPGVHSALKDFNNVFEACLETVRTIERNDVPNFTPDEVLIHSNMNLFFNVKGARKGSFDRTLRAIDRYCEALRPAEIKRFVEDLNTVSAALKELEQKTAEINAWLATRPGSEDPISVAAGYELLGMCVESLVKDGRALLEKINSGTKCAAIRAGTFVSGGMMSFADIANVEEGQPQYRSRTYRAYRTCRDRYNAAAAQVYERHKNEPGVTFTRW